MAKLNNLLSPRRERMKKLAVTCFILALACLFFAIWGLLHITKIVLIKSISDDITVKEIAKVVAVIPQCKPEGPKIIDYATGFLEDGKKIWRFRLNEDGIKEFRKGHVVIRLFCDYCSYDGTEVSDNGWITVPAEWQPPGGRISAGLFKITNNPEIGSGFYFCSVLIRKGG
jgi:hypothetical protein